MRYWLMKTEPQTFGVDHLAAAPRRTSPWDGVRNFQARNMLRDQMQRGDEAFLYHSSCEVPGIAAIVRIVKGGYPDATAFERKHHHYDADSDPKNPRWFMVDVQLQRIDLPEEVANAVYQRMQQSLVTQAQQLRAQGIADADKIRSDAEHKRAEILADATREAQRVRGEADAAAAATYARAYGANPEFAAFTRSLQAYKSSLGREGDILVISPEGEFFKYLHSASGH